MNIVGGDAFNTYHISYHYFKNKKKSPKIHKLSDRQKKAQAVMLIPYRTALYDFKTIE